MTGADLAFENGSARRLRAAAGGRVASTEAALLVGLVLAAAVIRLLVLDNQSLWADEALTAFEARLSFGSMLHVLTTVEVTPPLYFVLIWVWAKLFGVGAIALRAVSALAGVALVPVAWGATRELVSRRAGLVAAALVTVNPFLIWYSQEARAYMLLTLLCGASFWCFARVLRAPTARRAAAWAALSALALATHFFAGFLIAGEAVILLWSHRSRLILGACAVVAVVQLALLPLAVLDTGASRGTSWIARVPIVHRLAIAIVEWGASNLYRRSTVAIGLAAGLAVVLAVVLLLWRAGAGPERRGAAIAAAVAAPVLVLPILLRAVGQDYFLSRNEMPAVVPVVCVLAAAATAPRVRVAGAAFAAALLAVFAFTAVDVQTHPYLERADWRKVARALGPALQARAVLAAGGTTAQPLKIYLPGVAWNEPPGRHIRVTEIDVVGATKRLALVAHQIGAPGTVETGHRHHRRPAPLPVLRAPRGTRLIARIKVANWVVARFALTRPQVLDTALLRAAAGRYFAHVPAALLSFFQGRR